ncbi:HHR027Cp [Eremothecium sinecaudum]|uniref:E3 ubiquitin-protein ligase n=1 Tax=Eremothecium sinecaudum TaxID=45286 RepID=A0A0X8HW36_9SACH|nr:HHR027Cp [Eremothecium sinecaudum]AMD22796.1 HHR027Cp [Eremothecium sinecaudum]
MVDCINDIRDFLAHLPRLSNYQINDTALYQLWKVLFQCLKVDSNGKGDIDWNEVLRVYESSNWKNGVFQSIHLPKNWRERFLEDYTKMSGSPKEHRGTSCNKHCQPTETVYYCFDCTKNPLYEICEECFDADKHLGHRWTSKVVSRPEGKICHCGDPSGLTDPENGYECKNSANNGPKLPLRYDHDERLIGVLSHVLDFIIDMVIYLKECDNYNVLLSVRHKSELKSEYYALQLYEKDCKMHVKDLAAKISKVLHKPLEYGIMMTNRLVQQDAFVVLLESKDTQKLQVVKESFASEHVIVHMKDRSEIFKEYLVDELIRWIYEICCRKPNIQRKLALRVAMMDVWNSRLVGMKLNTDSSVGLSWSKIYVLGNFTVQFPDRATFPWCLPWGFREKQDEKHDPRVLDIMDDYDKRVADTDLNDPSTMYQHFQGSRFQYLITDGAAIISKVSKYRMMKIICAIFTIIDDSKKCLAAQYLDAYCVVLFNTVASESADFKVSLMNMLSQYIFQNPAIANMIILSESGFIKRALRFAFALLSFSPSTLISCPPIPLSFDFKLPEDSIKSKRSVVCFKDIYLIMSTNTVPEKLLSLQDLMCTIFECFASFNSILPLRREAKEHVEFENFDFSSYYFLFSSILVMVDGYVRNVCLIKDLPQRYAQVRDLLRKSMTLEIKLLNQSRNFIPSSPINIWDVCKVSHYDNDPEKKLYPNRETICNVTSDVINFKVGFEVQNFFNPMSYFFKFVVQWSQCGRYKALPESMRGYFDLASFLREEKTLLYMAESALSTLVLIAQINVGFWVRNGTPIIHQLRMYTKYSMREFTYFSDIFNVQLVMSLVNPNDFMVTFLSRWNLKNWAEGISVDDYPDHETTSSMADQCLLLLIQLLSEVRSLTMSSSVEGFEKTMRSEIIHALCFHSCSHSALMNVIPEHVTKHPAFDLYVNNLADYTPPSGLTDHGIYTLKAEYFSEVDPYFVGFTATKRYEAEKLLRNRMEGIQNIPYEDTFVPAKEVISELKTTPFLNLYQITNTDIFGILLKSCLEHIRKFKYESMLSKVAHLLHLCLLNNLNDFVKIFWREYSFDDVELSFYNSIGSILFSFLEKDEFVNDHGKIREIFHMLQDKAPHVNIDEYLKEQIPSYDSTLLSSQNKDLSKYEDEFQKKKLAKKKGERLMRKLAKQQQMFMEKNNVTPEEIDSKESTVDSSVASIGWEYPDDTCVFCKMPRIENDTFVYFTHFEQNIVDKFTDFSDLNRLQAAYNDDTTKTNCPSQGETSVGHVVKSCGHGSHFSCMERHMKVSRNAHSHMTKNVPHGLGFALLFCPLCNSLVNSFLPRLCDVNPRKEHDNFNGAHINQYASSSELLDTLCLKSLIIFCSLTAQSKFSRLPDIYTLFCSIITNTISNTELITRSGDHRIPVTKRITNQQLLTLRLLTELKIYILERRLFSHQADKRSELPVPMLSEHNDWTIFNNEHLHNNVLLDICRYLNPLARKNVLLVTLMYTSIKRKLHQNFIALGITLVEDSGCVLRNEQYDMDWEADNDRPISQDAELVMNILQTYITALSTSISVSDLQLKRLLKWRQLIYQIIEQSILIFVRRILVLLFAEYPVGMFEPPLEESEINPTLSYIGAPALSHILMDFYNNDLPFLKTSMRDLTVGSNAQSFARKVYSLRIESPFGSALVPLPTNLSDLLANEDEQLQYRVNKHEVALCLFCGSKIFIQNASPLHNFKIGECTNHYFNECTQMTVYGCFLLVRSNTIYLAYGARGTFFKPPYVNKHGEVDEDYKYGTPVFLDERLYSHLSNDIVLGGKIPHLVHRLTENMADVGGWESM